MIKPGKDLKDWIGVVAKVAMNGGSFTLVTNRPFTKPKPVAAAKLKRTAAPTGSCKLINRVPKIMPPTSIIAAIDRSKPPANNTNVSPIAINPPMEAAFNIDIRFVTLRNAGTKDEKTTTTITKTIHGT